ncbi:MAG: 5-formyltetrahydrofolate cyclo-ligase [Pseudomonadota bacterium]
MNPDPDRHVLRRELRERRRSLPAAIRIRAAELLSDRLLALPFAPASGHVGGYWAMDGEIGLHAWQLRLPPPLRYCLPVLHEDDRLRFAAWRPGDALVTNRYGIPEPDVQASELLEPESMALVVLPLVGFDARGQRLGMGGGWYDRSFAFRQAAAPPPWLVGAAFATQQLDAIDARAWDVALDAVCSENATHLAKATA